ncbi:hypothetical protein DFP72DRAFT_147066 [Ephemerocybe angulata]|uniref:Uncharacterized protein n=1 Tax=Ephemerocybe angulata TaxID=980116 RepID=A0A8H6HBM4_9AGAR|nr:hypothetical protein DFP72DRAFT_147066 [Tulosesus angulatus]
MRNESSLFLKSSTSPPAAATLVTRTRGLPFITLFKSLVRRHPLRHHGRPPSPNPCPVNLSKVFDRYSFCCYLSLANSWHAPIPSSALEAIHDAPTVAPARPTREDQTSWERPSRLHISPTSSLPGGPHSFSRSARVDIRIDASFSPVGVEAWHRGRRRTVGPRKIARVRR